MIKIYILKTHDMTKDDVDGTILSLPFGEGERQRLLSLGNIDRRLESLGGLMALWRLCDLCGVDLPKEIRRGNTGKPYFLGDTSPSFSISHTEGFAAAAMDTSGADLGLDIELIRKMPRSEQIAERFFSVEEKRLFYEQSCSDDCFFRIWTAKESMAKLNGTGLSAILADRSLPPCHALQDIIEADRQRLCLSLCQHTKISSADVYINGSLRKAIT